MERLSSRAPCASAAVCLRPHASTSIRPFVPLTSRQAQAASAAARRQQRQRQRSAVAPQAAGFGGFGKPQEKKLSKQKACPCGSGLEFKDCCQPYHAGKLMPDTPEQLMRSRYSAYVKGDWKYIVDTTHPLNPLLTDENAQAGKPTLKADVISTCEQLSFEKLKILGTEPGENDNEGYVTFQAWCKTRNQQGQRAQGWHTQTFVERSRFLRDGSGSRWLYVDGEQDWKR